MHPTRSGNGGFGAIGDIAIDVLDNLRSGVAEKFLRIFALLIGEARVHHAHSQAVQNANAIPQFLDDPYRFE